MKRATFYWDLLERTVWTALQGFLAAWLALGGIDGTTFKVAAIAGAGAAAKSLIAVQLPWTAEDSASTLPESVDPPQEQSP